MHIEIGAPAVLQLAFARLQEGDSIKRVMLGIALQHPPVHLIAEKYPTSKIRGPRAHVARQFADTIVANCDYETKAEIRIESTTPSLVGYNSDTNLALSMAQTYAWTNDANYEDYATLAEQAGIPHSDALAFWAAAEGGVVLVDMDSHDGKMPQRLRRHELKHRDHLAWSTIFHFPKLPDGIAENHEQEMRQSLNAAVDASPLETGRIINDELWPALEEDNFEAFGAAVKALRAINEATLREVGHWPAYYDAMQPVFDMLEEGGAVAWGPSFTGVGAFGLVYGSLKSQELRTAVRKKIGYMGGQLDATITDNRGLNLVEKDESMHLHDYPEVRRFN